MFACSIIHEEKQKSNHKLYLKELLSKFQFIELFEYLGVAHNTVEGVPRNIPGDSPYKL